MTPEPERGVGSDRSGTTGTIDMVIREQCYRTWYSPVQCSLTATEEIRRLMHKVMLTQASGIAEEVPEMVSQLRE